MILVVNCHHQVYFSTFLAANKPVFNVEYDLDLDVCEDANDQGLDTILKVCACPCTKHGRCVRASPPPPSHRPTPPPTVLNLVYGTYFLYFMRALLLVVVPELD